MRRRQFLKLSSGATVGLGINTNGLSAKFIDWFNPLTTCSSVSNRVLVIVRMAGANDGLNTLVPLNQFSQYANLRPTIRLNETGATGVVNLDTTLAVSNQVGLHPSLLGFKNLYDAGKLAIIHSVGYPNPNYSHFIAENIMFAGKDGDTSSTVSNGFMGRYLDTIYPGLSGNPQSFMSDPLALHFGTTNPCLAYNHDHGTAEYNMSTIQNALYAQLANRTVPLISEYYNNLNYINFLEQGVDVYYNRVNTVFNAGFNSGATYPNTDLGRQLKTVARLLKGGSKTKVFQTTLGGFDTHASQVVSGDQHTGTHATLLANMSNSISSFMSDLAALGLEDRVMVVSFSEFGRKARENGSLGTDHGDIAPMFVVGKHVNPGVLGTPPNLSNVFGGNDGRFFASERQFDYRQIYTTLLQDWLGATDAVLNSTDLAAFQSQKLSLVKTVQNAYPSCLSGFAIDCSTNPTTVSTANVVNEVNGWSYYAFSNNVNNYVFAIEKLPAGTGANTNNFDVTIDISEILCSDTFTNYIKSSGTEATLAAGSYFNIKVNSALKPNGFVNMKWFVDANYISDLNSGATAYQTSSGATSVSPIMFLKKVNSKLVLPDNLRSDGLGIHYAVTPMAVAATGVEYGKDFYQFNTINQIDKVGGGIFKRVSSFPTNHAAYNVPPATPSRNGSIQFNTTTKTFEGHDGSSWQPLH
jgi:uncharacterized protein (DUF1501 family)